MDILASLRNAADKAQVTDAQKGHINDLLRDALTDAEKDIAEAVKILEEVKTIASAKKIGWHVKLLKKKVQLDKYVDAEEARKEKVLDKIEGFLTVEQRANLLIYIGEQLHDNGDIGPPAVVLKAIKSVEPELKLKDKQQKKKDKLLKFIADKQTRGLARIDPLMASLKEAVDKDDMAATEVIFRQIKGEVKDIKKTRKAVIDEMKSVFDPEQMATIMIYLMTNELETMNVALAAI